MILFKSRPTLFAAGTSQENQLQFSVHHVILGLTQFRGLHCPWKWLLQLDCCLDLDHGMQRPLDLRAFRSCTTTDADRINLHIKHCHCADGYHPLCT